MADWEFDGSVNFAPPQYRKQKYEEAENFHVKDEETAKQYIELMKYIHYLHGDNPYWVSQGHKGHNIDNYEQMLRKENEAWKLIQDEKFIFKNITYELHHKIWKAGFDYLRNLEPEVINNNISKKEYAIIIKKFNDTIKPLNQQAHEHGLIEHTPYWIKSQPLKIAMRKYGLK